MSIPVGNFDLADPVKGCTGWAVDPDSPSQALTIHFYANAAADAAGSVFIGSTVANLPRPDVNSATGYPGNHGFNWIPPTNILTPCRIKVYAYAIDAQGGNNVNPLLHGSPLLMNYLIGTISNIPVQVPISISASSQFAGAVTSMIWNGHQFVYTDDHGQELQSAINSQAYENSWKPECFNPTEAGSYSDKNGSCTSSHLLAFSAVGTQLQTQCNMAFFANPTSGSSDCPSPKNTTILSDVILTKTITLQFDPNIPQAIKYDISFQFPTSYPYYQLNTFELIAWYLPNSGSNQFNTFLQYDQNTGTNTDVSSSIANNSGIEDPKPVILSDSGGSYAAGIYCPLVKPTANYGYDMANYGFTNKIGCIQRINPIIPGQTYSFTAYLVVGSTADVTSALGALIAKYPNS